MLAPYLISLVSVFSLTAKDPLFTVTLIDDQISKGYDLAIGDVDGDGKPDILMADNGQFVWYRNGDWKRFVLLEHRGERTGASIAARDIDGKVEIAISIQGYQTNTADSSPTGSLYYLIRPQDPTHLWIPVELYRESAINTMQWVKAGDDAYQLVALPVDDTSQATSDTEGADLLAFEKPDNPATPWKRRHIRHYMQQTHQLEVYDDGSRELVYVCGGDGAMGFCFEDGRWTYDTADWLARGRHLREMRMGRVASRNTHALTAIEPHEANLVTIYTPSLTDSLFEHDKIRRKVVDRRMVGGNGLAMADFLGIGRDQIVVGSRKTSEDNSFGIKFFVPFNQYWEAIDSYWIDRNGMDCENLTVADMDGDGKLDIIASGGSTRDLKIYWNRAVQ